ncbi:MAG: hypothetical protein ABI990_08865 [Actinomycetota bacterium]
MNGFTLVAHSDLGGYGDGMQVVRHREALYVGHSGPSGMGTSILDVSDPSTPTLVDQWRAPVGTHTHKVQVADGLLLVNEERFRGAPEWTAGLVVYDVSQPLAPRRVGRFACDGAGVHRIVWRGGRYAGASATPAGADDRIWLVFDLDDPTSPREVARFALDEPQPDGKRYAAHHALPNGEHAYLGYGDANLVVLDVSDPTAPRTLGRTTWDGGDTHTCLPLPGRGLLVVTDEQVVGGQDAEVRSIRVLDASDPSAPWVLATCPAPSANGPLRHGPHNLHERYAGSFRSERFVYATYFSGGLVVYDLADPERPELVARWVPDLASPQLNDLWIEPDGRAWVTDRLEGGLYLVEPDARLRTLLAETL